jgi:hypothetical protein
MTDVETVNQIACLLFVVPVTFAIIQTLPRS